MAPAEDLPAGVALSVVVPVYGCASTVTALHRRVTAAVAPLAERFELILVDDCSDDGAWPLMRALAEADSRVVACRLDRNVGQHLATAAGLAQSRGDYVVVIDCDLQDPPEAIGDLYRAACAGFDIVFAKRTAKYRPVQRQIAKKIYVACLALAVGRSFDSELGSFGIASRRAIDAVLRMRDRDFNYFLTLCWVDLPKTTIEYRRAPRPMGRSTYSVRRLLSLVRSNVSFAMRRRRGAAPPVPDDKKFYTIAEIVDRRAAMRHLVGMAAGDAP